MTNSAAPARPETLESFLAKNLPTRSTGQLEEVDEVLSTVTKVLFRTDEDFQLNVSDRIANERVEGLVREHFESQGIIVKRDEGNMGLMLYLEHEGKKMGWVSVSNHSAESDPMILVSVSTRYP